MRRIFAAGLACVLLLGLGDAAAQQKWQKFRSAEAGFTALFPGTPKATSGPVQTNDQVLQREFQLDLGERTFEVAALEFPAGQVPTNNPDKDYFTKLVNSYAQGSGTVLQASHMRKLLGHPAIEAVTFDEASATHHLLDITVVGNRIYIVVSAGPGDHHKSADAARFRDSFGLIKN